MREKIYLFDWGDTLMVDFPQKEGKMCDWDKVEATNGAKEALEFLSKDAHIYIATGAAESSKDEIKKAFDRVGLSVYISDYFCKANLGLEKGTSEFLEAILARLQADKKDVTMVGDSYKKDIIPALKVGITAIFLSSSKSVIENKKVKVISSLYELIK